MKVASVCELAVKKKLQTTLNRPKKTTSSGSELLGVGLSIGLSVTGQFLTLRFLE